MPETKPKFDPAKYKQTTLEQWNSAAEAWQEIEDRLNEYQTDAGFRGPCELVVAVGTK